MWWLGWGRSPVVLASPWSNPSVLLGSSSAWAALAGRTRPACAVRGVYAWGSRRLPSPCGPCSVYAGAPKPALCPCSSPVVLCLCVFLGAVACVSLWLCVWLCCDLYESAPSVSVWDSVCPSFRWCCASLSQRGRLGQAPPINLSTATSPQPCASSSGGGRESAIWN